MNQPFDLDSLVSGLSDAAFERRLLGSSGKQPRTPGVEADLQAPVQQWRDRKYCQQYAETWEISTDEVHYGWLAPGENTVRLLAGVELRGATVLDVGCGMGENLMSLAKKGASCFGIDISEHMLRYARGRHREIALIRQDMRQFSAFPRIFFDVVLSVYSLEYLDSLKELRDVFATLFSRLRPGGTFVFCFSHPLQHVRHSMLRNESAISGPHHQGPLIYSFKDVAMCLDETGFTIDRIIEQQTLNPSIISYEQSLLYPYHFHEGKNPCSPALDKDSNAGPHTVIYKARRPNTGSLIQRQMSLDMQFGSVRIWGETRKVRDPVSFEEQGKRFRILRLEPIDAVVGVCSVARFKITRSDTKPNTLTTMRISGTKRKVSARSLLGVLFARRKGQRLAFTFEQDWIPVPEHGKLVSGVFISRIDPVFGEFQNVFPREEIGVLVFVNGAEPGDGKVGLEEFFPALGDTVEVVYVAFDRAKAAVKDFLRNDRQLDLFSIPSSDVQP